MTIDAVDYKGQGLTINNKRYAESMAKRKLAEADRLDAIVNLAAELTLLEVTCNRRGLKKLVRKYRAINADAIADRIERVYNLR